MVRRFLWLVGFASLLLSAPCTARVEETLTYTKKQSFDAALRFLRVENGYSIVEKDMDSGYLLFEYPTQNSSKTTSGSIEVIPRGNKVALIIQLPQMPHYHERLLAAGLLKKLRADYGEPPRAASPDRKKPKDSEKAPPGDEDRPAKPPTKPPA